MRIQDKDLVDAQLLGNRLRRAREMKGLSQEDLAAETGLDQRAISELENGKRRMAVTELPIIAQILGVPLLYFFDDVLSTSDLDNALLQEFHRLPNAKVRKMALDMLRVMSDTLDESDTR